MHKLFASQPTAHQFFKVVAGKVIKATLVMKGAEIFSSDEYTADIAPKALMTGSISRPSADLVLDEATEADLIAAKSASPSQTHEIDTLIKFLRATKEAAASEPASPSRVEITNASELTKDGRSDGGQSLSVPSARRGIRFGNARINGVEELVVGEKRDGDFYFVVSINATESFRCDKRQRNREVSFHESSREERPPPNGPRENGDCPMVTASNCSRNCV